MADDHPVDSAEDAAEEVTDGEEAPFPIVGVGASAGGLHAFETLLEHLPDDPGMAFIFIQHLSPDHESSLAELLQRATGMDVRQAEEGQRVAPGGVYVIPPGQNLGIEGDVLHLTEQERERFRRAPIDFFFRTLAEDQRERAIGVVLSGTGAGGTEGLKRIKERGGLTLAQDPDEAEYDGMPRSAVATGLVDFTLPLKELAEKLAQMDQQPLRARLPQRPEDLTDDDADTLHKILAQLRSRTGHDFASYKRSTMLRRITRRAQVTETGGLADYLDHLREHPGEAQTLFRELLISVTNFFRDPDAFAALREQALPKLLDSRDPNRKLRVWVPGCATGEEAYSVLMLLHEAAARRSESLNAQVFASDLDTEALATAREGVYPASIEADVEPERLQRFFTKDPDGYRIRKDLRQQVLFADHNLLKDPPFSKQDLISCRNLLIYLNPEMQEQVFDLFHYALRPNGFLLLGSSESTTATGHYATVDKSQRLYQRRDTEPGGRRAPLFPLTREEPDDAPARPRPEQSERRSFGALHHQLLEEEAPGSIIVNANHEVLHLSENAGGYLRLGRGELTRNLLEMVDADLRMALRPALYQALQKGKAVERQNQEIDLRGERHYVTLRVRPIREEGFEQRLAQVLIKEEDGLARAPGERGAEAEAQNHLEEELRRTREELRATVEEYETSNEELKASNEELQSMNEELKSATEELETSQEELRSTNEELTTVNQELQNKNAELDRAKGDLENLLVSTEIGTLFLDRDLRIQRYTPRITDLFNVKDADLGRRVTDLTRRAAYDDLADDARRVLDHLDTIEREVEAEDGRWYLARLQPYRTVEDKIDGVVVTFVEFTERRETKEKLRASEERQRFLLGLSDALRDVAEARAVMTTAAEYLGRHLEADRAGYAEIDSSGEAFAVHTDWTRAGMPSLAGERDLDPFGPPLIDALRSGQTVAFEDAATHPLTTGDEAAAAYEGASTRAAITTPRIKDDRFVAALYVHQRTPRAWTPADAALVEDTAERTWAAVERARVEEDLRQLNADLEQRVEARTEDLQTTVGQLQEEAEEHQKTEEALRASRERFQKIFRLGPFAASMATLSEGRIVEVNDTYLEITGYARDEVTGQTEEALDLLVGSATCAQFRAAVAEKRGVRNREMTLRTKGGGKRTIIASAEVITADGEEMVLLSFTDATERKVLEQEVLDVAEREQRRIGRELHDELGQRLVGVSYLARGLRRTLGDDHPDLTTEINEITEEINEVLDYTRDLSHLLVPSEIENGGLGEALSQLAANTERMAGIAVSVEIDGAFPLRNEAAATHLYRIVQEAITNAVRHATPDHITIRLLNGEDGTVVLRIEDDGTGIAPGALENAEGLGLRTMRYRADLIGCTLDVHPGTERGTVVDCAFPAQEEA